MKRFISIFTGLILVMLAIGSCKKENLLVPKPNENLRPAADFLKNNYDFKIMYAGLEHADLVNELNSAGPFTVLAINDDAFRALGINSEDAIKKLNKDSVKRMLEYHVLKNRRLPLSDIPSNAVDAKYQTLTGFDLYTSTATNVKRYFFDGAGVTRGDIPLANGVLHVLNKAMKYDQGKKVQDFLTNNPNLTIFVAGLKKFGIWEQLDKDGPYTIFAPTNKAFQDHGITLETVNEWNVKSFHKRLFNCYIMYGKRFFVSDKYIFYQISQEYNYRYTFQDDNWYINFGLQEEWMTSTIYPMFQVFKPIPGKSFDDLVGSINFSRTNSNAADFDFRFDNGIIHVINQIFIRPDQTLNNQ